MSDSSFELNCGDYDVKSASIGHGSGGSIFRCTIGPLPDDLLAALADTARSKGTVRLVFPERPLVLERIAVERVEGFVTIVGRVVEPS